MINIGIMGCADIARRLMIPAILQIPEQFKVVGIASRTLAKAQLFANQFDCEAVEGYETLILRKDIDAIYMPLPTGLHKEWINMALKAGKHVYAEKSIAMTAEDAVGMVETAKENKVALMEGYMFQYHKQHLVVKDIIAKEEIGKVRLIRASFGFPPFVDSKNFRYDNKIGGGALKDTAGYVWRVINFLLGNIFEIGASNVHYDNHGTSLYGTIFATASDKISAEMSFGFDNYYQCNYDIWGSKGKISCLKAFTPKPDEKTEIVLEKQNFRKTIEIEPDNHFIGAMNEFYSLCIDEGNRQKHYDDIIYQAKGLDRVEKMSQQYPLC